MVQQVEKDSWRLEWMRDDHSATKRAVQKDDIAQNTFVQRMQVMVDEVKPPLDELAEEHAILRRLVSAARKSKR